jgi:hypothetical protein
MYDFWFTLGVATIKPALLDEINGSGPAFDFVDRLTIEITGGLPALRPKAPGTGLLEAAPTTKVRETIAKFVRNFSPAAPPIGIYCAGRFCQMMKIPFFSSTQPGDSSFKDIITLANQGYIKAVGAGPASNLPMFPAFLGLCLMDGNFVFEFDNPTPKLTEAVSEFGIVIGDASRDWQIAKAFVKTDEFSKATQLLMVSNMSCWAGGGNTFEQMFFWIGKSEHAIC